MRVRELLAPIGPRATHSGTAMSFSCACSSSERRAIQRPFQQEHEEGEQRTEEHQRAVDQLATERPRKFGALFSVDALMIPGVASERPPSSKEAVLQL
jgi:hypothetical protein